MPQLDWVHLFIDNLLFISLTAGLSITFPILASITVHEIYMHMIITITHFVQSLLK